MRKKNIKINLFDGGKSLEEAIRQIEQYRDELPRKAQQLCQRLAEEGVKVANVAINSVPVGKTITLTTDINPSKMGCQAIMKMTGRETRTEDGRVFYTALAIEFSAGVRYANTASPRASDFGMGTGTFPDAKHSWDIEGWYYLGDDGNWHHSFGVQASHPLYSASMEMRQKIDSIVKEVFG